MSKVNRMARQSFVCTTGAEVRGFLPTPAVVMMDPKHVFNLATMIRNCACFGITALCWTGDRIMMPTGRKGDRMPREERMREFHTVQVVHDDFPLRLFAPTAVPVAVEITRGTEVLPIFEHPKEAIYVFGPEDGSLSTGMLDACYRFVQIPTHHCLNVAQAGGVVLYDRTAKLGMNA